MSRFETQFSFTPEGAAPPGLDSDQVGPWFLGQLKPGGPKSMPKIQLRGEDSLFYRKLIVIRRLFFWLSPIVDVKSTLLGEGGHGPMIPALSTPLGV